MDTLLHTVVVSLKTVEARAAEHYVQSALTHYLPRFSQILFFHQTERYVEAFDAANFHYILSASTFVRRSRAAAHDKPSLYPRYLPSSFSHFGPRSGSTRLSFILLSGDLINNTLNAKNLPLSVFELELVRCQLLARTG